MKNRILPLAAISSLTLASFALAPAALATENFEFDFDFSPVEVSTEIGAEKAYDALEERLETECAPKTNHEKIFNRVLTEQCVDNAIETAVLEMDKPELTAIHKARRG